MTQSDKSQQARSVLIVEDNPADYFLLKEALGSYARMVIVTNSVELAAQMDRAEDFDLIICDLILPGSSPPGPLVESLRDRYPSSILIAVSGHADAKIAMEVITAGADDYQSKIPGWWEIIRQIVATTTRINLVMAC